MSFYSRRKDERYPHLQVSVLTSNTEILKKNSSLLSLCETFVYMYNIYDHFGIMIILFNPVDTAA